MGSVTSKLASALDVYIEKLPPKSSAAVSPYSQDCSVFCSPNGKRFTSLEKVHEFERELEKAKLEKEKKRLLASENSRKLNTVKVNNSSMLVCNFPTCQETFFSPTMLRKHERVSHF